VNKLTRTIGVDDKLYSEMIGITGQLMQKSGEQVSLNNTTRLAVALFKSCLLHYPRLAEQILAQISFDKEANKGDWPIEEITFTWFGKDFLDYLFGNKDLTERLPDNSEGPIAELRKKGIKRIYSKFNGQMFEAELTEDSKIRTLNNGEQYGSLSKAAKSICGYEVNGKLWWRYLNGSIYRPVAELLQQ
jgi:hypothetical protein